MGLSTCVTGLSPVSLISYASMIHKLPPCVVPILRVTSWGYGWRHTVTALKIVARRQAVEVKDGWERNLECDRTDGSGQSGSICECAGCECLDAHEIEWPESRRPDLEFPLSPTIMAEPPLHQKNASNQIGQTSVRTLVTPLLEPISNPQLRKSISLSMRHLDISTTTAEGDQNEWI